MAVTTNARARTQARVHPSPRKLSHRAPPPRALAGGGRVVPLRELDRRPARGIGAADRHRPVRLVAAPFRAVAAPCGPRTAAGSIGWLILLAGLAFLVVLGVLLAGGGQDTGASPVPERTVLVQVHQGETLWAVARRMAPSAAPAAVVDRIRALNGLADGSVYPGELLQVPSGLSAGAAAAAGAVQH